MKVQATGYSTLSNGGNPDSDCTITRGKAELFWKVMAHRKGRHKCFGGLTSRLTLETPPGGRGVRQNGRQRRCTHGVVDEAYMERISRRLDCNQQPPSCGTLAHEHTTDPGKEELSMRRERGGLELRLRDLDPWSKYGPNRWRKLRSYTRPIAHAVPIWAQQQSGIGQAAMNLTKVRPLASLDATRHGRKMETPSRLIDLIVGWVRTTRAASVWLFMRGG